ncbi:MAG: nucleotidyltransferase domain-containing protein [Planctomycetaceae bacterium]|nr:nucleotidyltransferase domain-containing protein [Planctomycetaceae bacterium]
MIADIKGWTNDAVTKLRGEFAERLVYVGLQGSYRRGEAKEGSDIDLVVVIDALGLNDLDRYRGIVHAMPGGGDACGFISDVTTLARWPGHELFTLRMDTVDYYGDLASLLPPLTDEDVREAARVGASGLYHMVAHSYLYGDGSEQARGELLTALFKGAFFVMLAVEYRRSGIYYQTKTELLRHLDGDEAAVMAASIDYAAWVEGKTQAEAFALLLDWTRRVIASE